MTIFLVMLVFIFSVAAPIFSKEIKGTVTKIEGKKITVKDAAGEETTVEVKEIPTGLKTGDSVTVKDGMVVPVKKEKPAEGC